MTAACHCPDPGLCARLGRHINGRLWSIWTDTAPDLAPDVRAAYRRAWEKEAVHGQVDGQQQGPFQRVCLLNLVRRPDRLEEATRQLSAADWPFRWPDLFPAVDGAMVPVPHGYQSGSGAWGCLQSHRQMLERALLDGLDCVLVLEDDIALRQGFRAAVLAFLAAVPADWDGLMLGGQHHRPAERIAPGVVRCLNAQRTHSYAVRGQYLRDLYRLWCSPHQTVHCDWTMGPFMGRYRVYAPDPWLIGQRSSHSDITCRRQPAKFWQPPTGTEPIVKLRADRPTADALRERGWHRGYDLDPHTGFDKGLILVAAGQRELKRWVDELQWEVVSEEGWLLCVWHPAIAAEQIRAAWPGPVYEIAATSAADALSQLAAQRGGLSRGA